MQKELCDMSREEKKKFLTMDLAERMIRVEQNISTSFGKNIPYNKTNFYLSMVPKQRKEFEEYLKNKTKKRIFFSLLSLIPLIFIGLVNLNFTGNAIRRILTDANILLLEQFAVGAILIFLIIGIILFISKRNFDKRFKHHTKIIDKFVIGKHFGKK